MSNYNILLSVRGLKLLYSQGADAVKCLYKCISAPQKSLITYRILMKGTSINTCESLFQLEVIQLGYF